MRMLKTAIMALYVTLLAASSTAAQKKGGVHGELVELVSYVKEGIKPTSPAGKEIAMENVKKGGILGVLEKKTNKMYLLAPAAGDTAFTRTMSGYFGVPVYVKGSMYRRAGINVIVVEDIGKSIK